MSLAVRLQQSAAAQYEWAQELRVSGPKWGPIHAEAQQYAATLYEAARFVAQWERFDAAVNREYARMCAERGLPVERIVVL